MIIFELKIIDTIFHVKKKRKLYHARVHCLLINLSHMCFCRRSQESLSSQRLVLLRYMILILFTLIDHGELVCFAGECGRI